MFLQQQTSICLQKLEQLKLIKEQLLQIVAKSVSGNYFANIMGYLGSSHRANKKPASSRFLERKCRYRGFKCIYEYLVYRYVQLNINRKIYPTSGTRNNLRHSAISVSYVTRFNRRFRLISALHKFRHKAATSSIKTSQSVTILHSQNLMYNT